MPKICGPSMMMMDELEVRELGPLVRSSTMIGNDVVGRGIKENMKAIKKRGVRLRKTDAIDR